MVAVGIIGQNTDNTVAVVDVKGYVFNRLGEVPRERAFVALTVCVRAQGAIAINSFATSIDAGCVQRFVAKAGIVRSGVLNTVIRDSDTTCIHNVAVVDFAVRQVFPVKGFMTSGDCFVIAVAVAINDVIACAACDAVITGAAIKFVIACIAHDAVVAGPTKCNVVAVHAFEDVVACFTKQCVIAILTAKRIIACAAINFVVTVAGKHKVVACTCNNKVIITHITRKYRVIIINEITIRVASVVAVNHVITRCTFNGAV